MPKKKRNDNFFLLSRQIQKKTKFSLATKTFKSSTSFHLLFICFHSKGITRNAKRVNRTHAKVSASPPKSNERANVQLNAAYLNSVISNRSRKSLKGLDDFNQIEETAKNENAWRDGERKES